MRKAAIAGAIILSLGVGELLSDQAKAQVKSTDKALRETIDIKGTTNADSLQHITYIHQELDSLPADIIVQETIKEINMIRQSYGLDTVKINNNLCKAAQLHAQDMSKKNYFSHVNKDGKHSRDRVDAQNYWARISGENIAKGHTIVDIVDKQRIQSAGHKATMLMADAKDIGIGYYKGYMVMLIANPY